MKIYGGVACLLVQELAQTTAAFDMAETFPPKGSMYILIGS